MVSICFRGFCVPELFLRKDSVIETILIDYFVFSAVFVAFVLRFFTIRVICVICGGLILLVPFVLRVLKSVRSV